MNVRFWALLLLLAPVLAGSGSQSQTTAATTQSDPLLDGIWRAETSIPWAVALRLDGSEVAGVVSSCASNVGEIEVFDGAVEGSTLTFKCQSLDGRRTVAFTGTIGNDEIGFRWEKTGLGNAADDAIFGDAASRTFLARRVRGSANATEARLADAAERIRRVRPVSFDDVLRADETPQNWLTYSGNTFGHRHSKLTQITPGNATQLQLQWVHQAMTREPSNAKFEATPLVVDGILYTVLPVNDVAAIDAVTGKELWIHRYEVAQSARGCCGRVNRGLAMLGNRLFMGTFDAHLIAIDANNGRKVWDVPLGRPEEGYSITQAPLVVKNLVIVGPAGAERGIRGFVAAFDAMTGREVWRFNTVPGPGEPGHNTWEGDSWKTGGAAVWMTGSYDSELNLTYWGVGNPAPSWNGDRRSGDNLFSNSVIALDADTGKLKWHFQFTPHDEFDLDSAQVPVLVDMAWQGKPRKLMLFANKNGFFYVLDRVSGEFLLGKPFVEVTWARGLDPRGRPIVVPETLPQRDGGALMAPGAGGTNWAPPSFSAVTNLFYVPAFDGRTSRHTKADQPCTPGQNCQGGGPKQPRALDEANGYGTIRAIDPTTGSMRWELRVGDRNGLLTTASNVLFTGDRDGSFHAVDARTGAPLWQFTVGGSTNMAPMTYAASGRQFVVVASGMSTFAFALPQ
jgi:alcohol dehydrogenase (cytochrome c)